MYKKFTFPSGLRLITAPSKATKAVTVFVIFGVGSRYENEKINGASHFIEHLMFKGTKKRPTTLDISKELDGVGAEFNAGTAKDWTCYYIKINSEKIELAMDVLSDMLYNSKFDNKEINKERGVIIEEINMYHDNPLMYIEDLLEMTMYQKSTLGWEIAGPRSVIEKVSRRQMIDYMKEYYSPNNTVIGLAGNVPAGAKILVEKYFHVAGHKKSEPESFEKFTFTQNKPQVNLNYKKTEQVQLAIGFPGFSYFDKKVFALSLLTIILGGNMSSRLFISVRERKGLAYFVRCYPSVYQDTGNCIIQAGLDKKRMAEALKVIFNELKKIKKYGVSSQELKKAKDYLRGNLILSLEDSSHLAEFFAKQEILQNKIYTPEEKMKIFDRVTAGDIKKVAKEIFRKELCSLALIGPFNDKKFFEKFIVV